MAICSNKTDQLQLNLSPSREQEKSLSSSQEQELTKQQTLRCRDAEIVLRRQQLYKGLHPNHKPTLEALAEQCYQREEKIEGVEVK